MRPRLKLNPLAVWDPGLFRLRQAARTVLGVGVSLALFHRFGSLIALFAAFATAAFMQANSGAHRRQRQIVMLVTCASTTLLVFIGGLCHGHRLAVELLLIATAAGCFYARRFVPDRNLFTLYSFTLCLLATTFAGPWPQPLWIALAVLTAVPIAFVVYFYIWPPVFHRRFAAAVGTFRQLAAHCLEALGGALADPNEAPGLARWQGPRPTGWFQLRRRAEGPPQAGSLHARRIATRVARLRAAMSACATLASPLRGSSTGAAADALVRLMRRVVVCLELLQENLPLIGDRPRSDLGDALGAMSGAFRDLCNAYAANLPASLSVDTLRARVTSDFESAPDHERDEHAAAALLEAATLAARLDELRGRMATALSDRGFSEER